MYDKVYIFRAKDWIGQTIQVNTGPFLKNLSNTGTKSLIAVRSIIPGQIKKSDGSPFFS